MPVSNVKHDSNKSGMWTVSLMARSQPGTSVAGLEIFLPEIMKIRAGRVAGG